MFSVGDFVAYVAEDQNVPDLHLNVLNAVIDEAEEMKLFSRCSRCHYTIILKIIRIINDHAAKRKILKILEYGPTKEDLKKIITLLLKVSNTKEEIFED